MNLTESIKNFLNTKNKEIEDYTSNVQNKNVLSDLTDDEFNGSGAFFDDDATSNVFSNLEATDVLRKQREKIQKYRNLALEPDVTEAIDEIVNEITFTYDDKMPIKLSINEENDKLVSAIRDCFDKITRLMDIKRNLFKIVRTGYVDGQIVLHTAFKNDDEKAGIQKIKLIEPSMLHLKDDTYRYLETDQTTFDSSFKNVEYSREEICKEDFGLYDGRVNLGYLEYAIKPANMLKTLEDLLVPLRFSRSISRRVFNVDIGDLPSKRGSEVMRDYQNKFKYKKFYNNQTGEVSNQQHITSMVEDYWFANRSGGKGTTVDLLDETGNLGELDDVLYFNKKLYKSLKIPSSRIRSNPDANGEFSFDDTTTSKEDLKFFMFISRLRQVYSSLFKEVLKREVVSTGVMSAEEYKEKEDSIEISFVNENKFVEKMKLDAFMSKLDIYSSASEFQGKIFSHKRIMKDVFRFTDEEIDMHLSEIEKERKDPKFKSFYEEDDF